MRDYSLVFIHTLNYKRFGFDSVLNRYFNNFQSNFTMYVTDFI